MSDKPKIIIDDDWKSQVESEKEALRAEEQNQPAGGADGGEGIPPASLPLLITMLATQAMIALGQLAPPGTQPEYRPEEARHFIDLLQVLDEKTAGNRTPQESQMLEALLHELRMTVVAVEKSHAGK